MNSLKKKNFLHILMDMEKKEINFRFIKWITRNQTNKIKKPQTNRNFLDPQGFRSPSYQQY